MHLVHHPQRTGNQLAQKVCDRVDRDSAQRLAEEEAEGVFVIAEAGAGLSPQLGVS
jgi:hypothetical protein